jgi:hypothetical protein
MREEIIKMSNNIGSLSLFLKNDKNKEYLDYINNNIPAEVIDYNISEKVYYFINDIKSLILCQCNKHKKFIGFKNGYRETCGDKKCYVGKRRETCIDKWGVDNPKKSKEVIKKEKENIKNKWGVDHYMLSDEVKNKFKETMRVRWGVEWAQQSDEIKSKSLETWSNNVNKEDIIKNRTTKLSNKSIEEKEKTNNKKRETIEYKWGSYDTFIKNRLDLIKIRSIEKWGVDHHFKVKEIIEKRIVSYKNNIIEKIKSDLPENLIFNHKKENLNNTDSILNFTCNICNTDFDVNRQLFYFRKREKVSICLNCNPILVGKSKRELEVLDLIKCNYDGEILTNIKNLISGELDIYLPELNLAFEFNGLYWHSDLYKDRLFHLNKTKQCRDSNISLIHIWEDDWDYKKNIVKSIILNKLGKSEKIWARKCEIKEISDNKIVRDFLEKNHIQGFVGSKIKIGLFYEGELVSIMTFGNLRRSLGQKSKEGSYELLRFCNKLNTTVIGGASRLFKYFIDNYDVKEVISYSDNSRGGGDMYKKLGFQFESETEPNYYWIVDGVRKHRFNFRKDKLVKNGSDPNKTEVEIMNEMGYYRIFDCGSKKWKLIW